MMKSIYSLRILCKDWRYGTISHFGSKSKTTLRDVSRQTTFIEGDLRDNRKSAPQKSTDSIKSGPLSAKGKKSFRNYDRKRRSPKKIELADEETKQSDLENLSLIKEPFAIISRGKARLFLEGNPIVYDGAISEVRGNPTAGDFILVTDHHGNPIGKGFFNPHSQYRVRLLTLANERPVCYFNSSVQDILTARIRKAIQLRTDLFTLPNEDVTTAYRLINGEGDRLSGLIVEVFENFIVVQSCAYWVEQQRTIITDVLQNLLKQNPSFQDKQVNVIWRQLPSRLTQDGYKIDEKKEENNKIPQDDGALLITIKENGIKYQLSPYLDQKTGFYCDQRENRLLIQSLVKGKRVLDLYCYTGGFTLNAALRGNPASVTAIDSSAQAIERAKANYELNLISLKANKENDAKFPEEVIFMEGDSTETMKRLKKEGKEYDFIICDPPKLAPTKQSLQKAKSKYQQINMQAMSLINQARGGFLFTFTCSAAMTQSNEFLPLLQHCAKSCDRFITVIKIVGASSDHPVALSYSDSNYLTGVLLYVH